MSDDVRAAAERAVRWYESMRRYGGRWDALADDIVQSARAVLAELPADDGEPVTEARLPGLGFRHSYGEPSPTHKFDKWVTLPADFGGDTPVTGPWAEVTVTRDGVRLETYGSDRFRVMAINPTLAQMRACLRMVGVTLREGGAT